MCARKNRSNCEIKMIITFIFVKREIATTARGYLLGKPHPIIKLIIFKYENIAPSTRSSFLRHNNV